MLKAIELLRKLSEAGILIGEGFVSVGTAWADLPPARRRELERSIQDALSSPDPSLRRVAELAADAWNARLG